MRRAAKKLDCTLTAVRREGAPFFWDGSAADMPWRRGLALCGTLLFLGSFFIWDFAVEGNQRVTEEEILRALEKNGVGLGTFGIALDTEDIRNHVLLDIPELVWITVRVSGCRATVEVREREEVPEPVNERAPATWWPAGTDWCWRSGSGWGEVCAAGHLRRGRGAVDLRRGGTRRPWGRGCWRAWER